MPGFNQQGPMNEGPMTGRARGNCSGSAGNGQRFSGRGNAMGMGRQNGRRGGQTIGWGRGYGQQDTFGPSAGIAGEDALQNNIDKLEAELAAVKQQLKNLSESEK
ncbi:DUF5320 domain-containing protein [Desulfobacula sp.]